jgi:CHAD domain-containing protein
MPPPADLSLLLHQALEPRLARLLELCRTEGWQLDPEGLHQVRIASRRVRAVLDLTDPSLYPGFKRHVKHLRGLTRALGLTRELDVHAGTLETLEAQEPDLLPRACIEYLLEQLEQARRGSREEMHRALGKVTLKDLNRLLKEPEFPGALLMRELPQAVWDCLEPWLAKVEDRLPPLLEEEEDAQALHELRIQVKRLRYTLEILEPAFPAPLETWLQHLKDLQTALGQHHDHALLEGWLREVHAGLEARQRGTLASGILDLATRVAQERLVQFERFQTLGREHRKVVQYFHLKHALLGDPGGGA